MPSSPPKPFAGRARLASLTERPVFTPRTDAVLSSAAPVLIESIEPNPNNPRQAFERDEAFAELVDSIREHGLLQPLLVRREGVRRVLIAGHRRLAALQQLVAEVPDDPRWRKVLVVERPATADEAFVLALVENLHREDLTAQDEASALEALEHQLGTAAAVAKAINRSEAYISKRKRIYKDPDLAPAVLARGLTVAAAEELLPIRDRAQRQQLMERAVSSGWDRDTVRHAVRKSFAAKDDAAAQESTEARPTITSDEKRSQALVRAIGTVRRLLHAGPATALSDEASAELHDLAQELSQQFPQG